MHLKREWGTGMTGGGSSSATEAVTGAPDEAEEADHELSSEALCAACVIRRRLGREQVVAFCPAHAAAESESIGFIAEQRVVCIRAEESAECIATCDEAAVEAAATLHYRVRSGSALIRFECVWLQQSIASGTVDRPLSACLIHGGERLLHTV